MESAARSSLLRLLGRVRRRALLARTVRYGSAGALYGVTALGIAALIWGRRMPPPGALLALFCLVLGLTLLLALRGVPSLVQVARLIDRERRLAERLETALELQEEHDEVALLLQSDAVEHLRTVDPRDVVPLRAGGSPKLAGLALAVFALATLAVERLPVTGGRDGARRGGSTAPAGRESERPFEARRHASPREPGESPGLGASQPPSPQTAASPSPAPPDAPPRPTSTPRLRGAAKGKVALAGATKPLSAAPGAPASQSPAAKASAGVEEASPAAARSRAGSTRPTPPVEDPPRQRGAGGAGGPSAGAGDAAGGQAGVAGEPAASRLALGTELPPRSGAPPAVGSESNRADWLAVERALATQRLPPGLERYVRAYLLAIRAE
jgi:hypothetical protein